MYTQCPECLTVFTVDARTVSRAHGCVSCCQCGATFDVMATLCDDLPDEPFESLPLNEPAAAPPLLLQPVAHEKPAQESLFAQPPTHATVDTTDATDSAPREDDHEPTFSHFRRPPRRQPRHPRWLLAGCAVMALVLVAQLGWAKRADLVRNPTAANWMQDVCQRLGCQLPKARNLDQLELTSRDIRRHPSVPDALMISATLHNSAPFRQPWPVISIRLSNLDNQPVAMRRFRPSEYLHDPALRKAGLAPGADAALVFEVVDPGRDAVAFEFDFM